MVQASFKATPFLLSSTSRETEVIHVYSRWLANPHCCTYIHVLTCLLLIVELLWYLHLQTQCCDPSLLLVVAMLVLSWIVLGLLSGKIKGSFLPCWKVDHLCQVLVFHQVGEWLGELCSVADGHDIDSVCILLNVPEMEVTSNPHSMMVNALSLVTFWCFAEVFHNIHHQSNLVCRRSQVRGPFGFWAGFWQIPVYRFCCQSSILSWHRSCW